MRETNGRQRRVSIKLKAAAAALVTIFAVAAIGTSGAQATSTPGGPISANFNYVGINVTALGNPLNELILTPDSKDADMNPLPPLAMNGTYNDANGNFTLPKTGGLDFPKLGLDISGVPIEAELGLAEPADGNFDDVTGAMRFNPKISLTLGTDHMEDLPPDIPISGTGPLKCQISPLDVGLSTDPINWPAPGKVFTDKALLTDGAVAGSWMTKPKVKSLITENSSLCPLIGGLLEPVGGLYLANSSTTISGMPAATATKPSPTPCPAGTTGTAGTPADECKVIPPQQCGEGFHGTFPDCVKDEVIVVPPEQKFTVSGVKIAGPGKIKAGKQVKLKIKVTNSGDKSGTTKVTLKSSNGKVKLPKSVKLTVAAGKTAVTKITVKAVKKAKGKAKITAKTAGKSAKKVLKIKAAG